MTMPLSDPERLDAVERSGLLKYPVQDRLVRICYTVTQLLDVDCSQVNIVTDRHQQTVAEWPRVPRRPPVDFDDSGCWSVIEAGETVVIDDTTQHPVLCTMPWAATWQGYLGTPVSWNGQHLGSLCALTVSPRTWQRHDVLALESLANIALSAYRTP